MPYPVYGYELESKHFGHDGVDPGQHHCYVLPIEFLPFSVGHCVSDIRTAPQAAPPKNYADDHTSQFFTELILRFSPSAHPVFPFSDQKRPTQ